MRTNHDDLRGRACPKAERLWDGQDPEEGFGISTVVKYLPRCSRPEKISLQGFQLVSTPLLWPPFFLLHFIFAWSIADMGGALI